MIVKKVITGYLLENCYIISKDNNCIIIDPGSDFDNIKKEVGNKKVLKVLITHYHFDHTGALTLVKDYYNCGVIDYTSVKKQKIGPFTFDIIDTKGHSKNSVTYYFKDEKIMFTGDFIFKGNIGRCDLEGGNVLVMKESIDKIKKYPYDIKIYPGHGDSTTLKEEIKNNPYMEGDIYE